LTALGAATLRQIGQALASGRLTSERLAENGLARIAAFDAQGPELGAVAAIDPAAAETARRLDIERRTQGPRSLLHGVPVVLKDNIDAAGLPTTAGSIFLDGWVPSADAAVVTRLRRAGAVVLAKVATTEFAVSNYSSVGPRPRNPHDLARSTSSSSNGPGVAVAAGYAPIAIGTDAGGSIRGPASANGITGLKPTFGLVARSGVVPLALSFDTVGPLARSVFDLAATLEVLAGADARDPATAGIPPTFPAHLTDALRDDALARARIGIARDFLGQDAEVDWVVGAALERLTSAGATLVEIRLPRWLLDCKGPFYTTIRSAEFAGQIGQYLVGTGPNYPKTFAELARQAQSFRAVGGRGRANPARWALFEREAASGGLDGGEYRAIHAHGLPLVRAAVAELFAAQGLDAVVYPTLPERPPLVDAPERAGYGAEKPTNIANLTGFPDLVVPAGFTSGGLPVGLSFLGQAFGEAGLLSLGCAFERLMVAFRPPVHAPALPGELEID
jgi:amidase